MLEGRTVEELKGLTVRELLERLAASEAVLHPAWDGRAAAPTDQTIRTRNAVLRHQAQIVRELRRRKNLRRLLGRRDPRRWRRQPTP